MVTMSTAWAAQIGQHLPHLPVALAEAHHQARFGVGAWPAVTHPLQQLQRAAVDPLGPHLPVEPRHGFDVVVQHLRGGGHHGRQGVPVAAEVRDQQLDRGERGAAAHLPRCRPRTGWLRHRPGRRG